MTDTNFPGPLFPTCEMPGCDSLAHGDDSRPYVHLCDGCEDYVLALDAAEPLYTFDSPPLIETFHNIAPEPTPPRTRKFIPARDLHELFPGECSPVFHTDGTQPQFYAGATVAGWYYVASSGRLAGPFGTSESATGDRDGTSHNLGPHDDLGHGTTQRSYSCDCGHHGPFNLREHGSLGEYIQCPGCGAVEF